MSNAKFTLPEPINEPILAYQPGSPQRAALKKRLAELARETIEIPLIIGGKEIRTGNLGKCVMPHDHQHVLATYHKGGPAEMNAAIEASQRAWKTWSVMPWTERASIFMKMAEMLSGPWRATLNGATMLGQSKNAFQAEIDSACELIDFLNFNVKFMEMIYEQQPISAKGMWNRIEQRALEGFVFAITPFNFTAIAGNLPTAPAMMGNTIVWKPASSAVYSAYYVMKLAQEAGLPAGVINFIPGNGAELGPVALRHPKLAGVHFTGSTSAFQEIWKTIGENIASYHTYPRIVGETGGKDFIFAHKSADLKELTTAMVRGAFEYQGQKCSAASRAYIPKSIWPALKEMLIATIKTIKIGDVRNFTNFVNAVIDRAAFDSITGYINYAKNSSDAKILIGGGSDGSKGYFIEPTIIVTNNPHFKTMEEEIFGPVLTVYVYDDDRLEETLKLCNSTSAYGLTGAIIAKDREVIALASRELLHAAGNFYINDKPTGAVVGQQPFGGSRASGTNDKAGSMLNLLKWVSPRTVKETFVPPTDYRYPFMEEE
ncbi:L-glutamate gamma-semialdehyde dehydrogenase [Candidatus Acetothermia bacterium]|jgi:1-pyrroline-5-carboxylate dehydrogenase|nr:L-glutamate gamma-semialdehyde dehydrogenase [Candidatus Acetothermia bacterium]MCI2427898.1 L-glutamate gamma-semialdehyde dehydrogenase [Candidatus Acetothermia bacterium]MCI2428097.1 L-glutamate gamma-semialdehyde dehydrogenase [Candidatus Acetothermia bacterium]